MARSRVLFNNAGTAWTVNQLGGIQVPAGGPGSLDITTFFTDAELSAALQNGLAGDLGATKYLRIDDGVSTYDINSTAKAAPFYNAVAPLINNQADAGHSHADAEGGGQLVGVNALSDVSDIGGANKIMKTDGSGNVSLGVGIISSSAVSFSADQIPNARWVQEMAQGKAFQGNVVSARVVGTAAADPGAIGAGKAYVATGAWGAFVAGDIIERNVTDTGWTKLKTGAAGDRLILEALGGGFSGGEQYSVIELVLPATPTFTKVVSASDGMYAIVSAGQHEDKMAIYDVTGKWQLHDWGTSLTAGDGIDISANEVSVKPDITTGATVVPVAVSSDGAGVTVDNDTIVHSAGVLSAGRSPSKGQKMLLAFGKIGAVPNATYLRSVDGIFGSVSTYRMIRAGKVTGMSAQLGTAGTTCDFEIHKNGILMDPTVDIALGAAAGAEETDVTGVYANNTFLAGDRLSVYSLNVSGGPNNAVVLVEVELT
ncbi:MAG: hypothetical protein A2Y38_04225 [Spirochaetes bacterium GWB1_59_5]|nr:MAG: hypothetical protein A2Y38_04225 [Spirochaetes bacterium GWB1_59_5]